MQRGGVQPSLVICVFTPLSLQLVFDFVRHSSLLAWPLLLLHLRDHCILHIALRCYTNELGWRVRTAIEAIK